VKKVKMSLFLTLRQTHFSKEFFIEKKLDFPVKKYCKQIASTLKCACGPLKTYDLNDGVF